MSVFWSTFFLIFIAEIADKSRLAGILLATTYRAPWAVFWGMTLGYILLDGLAVLLGGLLSSYIPVFWVKAGAAVLFIVLGVVSLRWGGRIEEEGKNWLSKVEKWGPFIVSFLAIGISEMGDRTQIAAATLSAETQQPWPVFGGAILALGILNGLTVWLGDKLAARLSGRAIGLAAGIIFILVGLFMLLDMS